MYLIRQELAAIALVRSRPVVPLLGSGSREQVELKLENAVSGLQGTLRPSSSGRARK